MPASESTPGDMNYEECLAYLDRLGNEVLTMKLGLETLRKVLRSLGDPQRRFPAILIAGTNGKGSVARFLSGILVGCGIRTGLYTSPHLLRPEERIVVDNESISSIGFAKALGQVVDTIRQMGLVCHPTYFETLTATAFFHFAAARVEIAVLEAGLGGRLDSTNVIDPILSVLTPIGLDHQNVLGNTLAEIAAEKAGIIHPGRPVVSSPQRRPAMEVLRSRAAARKCFFRQVVGAEIQFCSSREGKYGFSYRGIQSCLRVFGRHQVENAVLAIEASEILRQAGWPVHLAGMKEGLSSVLPWSVLQKVAEHPAVFVDGGHNPDAARCLAEFLHAHTQTPRTLVFGMMRDKDLDQVFGALSPCFERVFLTQIDSPRAARLEQLRSVVPGGIPCAQPMEALRRAKRASRTVLVAGSFFLAGQVLKELAGVSHRLVGVNPEGMVSSSPGFPNPGR
ncbi:MAG: bifunctional folylpolyglutamate synthase/dihydrofolate synthase [Acidobacteriota bacterium]